MIQFTLFKRLSWSDHERAPRWIVIWSSVPLALSHIFCSVKANVSWCVPDKDVITTGHSGCFGDSAARSRSSCSCCMLQVMTYSSRSCTEQGDKSTADMCQICIYSTYQVKAMDSSASAQCYRVYVGIGTKLLFNYMQNVESYCSVPCQCKNVFMFKTLWIVE